MKHRFVLFRRGNKFYCEDTETRKQQSLRTSDPAEAKTLLAARNEAARQPYLNLRIAQTYLAAADPTMTTRTWADVMAEYTNSKQGTNRLRVERAMKEEAFDLIREKPLVESRAEHFLRVLENGGVSTNNHLRRLHNFALGMNWLPWPVLPKKQWPPVKYRDRRGITRTEHLAILAREQNPERRAFYDLCWHLGGSQSDMAKLKAEDIDWRDRVISFARAKTGVIQMIHFGPAVEELLRTLPTRGQLFPTLAEMEEKHRASLFQCICRRLKITGISLHSYRYAWAERARAAGYPERFAQEALGHNSKAVHRAYARKAQVKVPSLEEYEASHREKIVPIIRACPKLDAVNQS